MNILKHILRVVFSFVIGYYVVNFFHLSNILSYVFYFAIYIVVSMIMEPFWQKLEKRNNVK